MKKELYEKYLKKIQQEVLGKITGKELESLEYAKVNLDTNKISKTSIELVVEIQKHGKKIMADKRLTPSEKTRFYTSEITGVLTMILMYTYPQSEHSRIIYLLSKNCLEILK